VESDPSSYLLTRCGTTFQVPAEYARKHSESKFRLDRGGYVFRISRGGARKLISVHSEILGLKEGFDIDHIDRNPLNNRRENLRHITKEENNQNRAAIYRSLYKGVTLEASSGKYRVRLAAYHCRFNVGRYLEEAKAVAAANIYIEVFQPLSTWINPTDHLPRYEAARAELLSDLRFIDTLQKHRIKFTEARSRAA
jgi:hypothetical protein